MISTGELLRRARAGKYAIGAFNVYNSEGVTAVIRAAEELDSPVILQVLPSALALGGMPIVALCRAAAKTSRIPAAVHLDHCPDEQLILSTLENKISSVMADGSKLPFADNIAFTRKITEQAHEVGAEVEGELGCLSGSEDGMSIYEYEEQLTRPDQAKEFVRQTNVSALAVCIGNRHGKYLRPPKLDFPRLEAIAKEVVIPLVLHGTSGLQDDLVARAISCGVCKFNVNTEIRTAYLETCANSFKGGSVELVDLMASVISAMKEKISAQILRFGSTHAARAYR